MKPGGRRNLDAQGNSFSLGLMGYRARFYDPYISHFFQPDTIIADQNNPQSLNPYSYTLSNPVRYNDPTGHMADECGPDGLECGNVPSSSPEPTPTPTPSITSNPTTQNPTLKNGLPCTFNYLAQTCIYSGEISDNLKQQLVTAGADSAMLDKVNLRIYENTPTWVSSPGCSNPNHAAVTAGTTISICAEKYFDASKTNPYLVHELVHVRQNIDDPSVWIKYDIQEVSLWLKYGNNPKHIHDDNTYEIEAMGCDQLVGSYYNSGRGLPSLNSATCNLVP